MKKFIPVAEPDLSGNEKKYLNECIDTGWISYKGQFVKRLQIDFAQFVGSSYVAAVSSGTAGLHLALLALGIGPGDEVIVPTLTFIASVNVIKYVGATPVFIDSEVETWNMDPNLLEKLITPKTKAILPVHIYGHPVNMDPVLKLAKKYKLFIIEDAAEAHGAEYKGKKVGTLGDIGVFSLFANKIITSGEGGLVVTDNKNLFEKIKLFRDQGVSEEDRAKYHYWHPVIGYNYGMSNLQAAVAVAQLERINSFIDRKREIAKLYTTELSHVKGISISKEASWAKSVFWMFSILLDENIAINRDEMINLLAKRGIDGRPFFYPIHSLPPYDTKEVLPVAQALGMRGINLPSSVKLTDQEIKFIASTIKDILN